MPGNHWAGVRRIFCRLLRVCVYKKAGCGLVVAGNGEVKTPMHRLKLMGELEEHTKIIRGVNEARPSLMA